MQSSDFNLQRVDDAAKVLRNRAHSSAADDRRATPERLPWPVLSHVCVFFSHCDTAITTDVIGITAVGNLR